MSADALALALTVAMVVFVLYMRYSKKKVMRKWQLGLMYILTGFLCLCKVVYMPFCLLLFLIPKERFRSRKNYWFHVVCAGAMILILQFWLACHCVQVSLRVSAGSGYGCPAYGNSEKSGDFLYLHLCGAWMHLELLILRK